MDFIERIRETDFLWIYGAGVVGKRVLGYLDAPYMSTSVYGIAVTNKDGNEADINGHTVFTLQEVNTPVDKSLFIIAVSPKHQREIVDMLHAKGYSNSIPWSYEIQARILELSKFRFVDRRRNLKKVCFVLGGYKDFLWDDVFARLQRYVPDDVEVCILSSGIWNEKLAYIADKNSWSYLSTSLNSVTLIQNMAISFFPHGEWIYKMDEDIFLTKSSFEALMRAYIFAEDNTRYEIGFSAPLIPLNGYGYIRLLEQLGKLDEYDKKFERALCGGNCKRMIESEAEAAAFMWGFEGNIPQLDRLNEIFGKQVGKYSICNVRFSIGFILYHRSFWEKIQGFDVSGGVDLGMDEDKIGRLCMNDSYAIVVAEDIVVGHFSFGKQTEYMKKLYEKNREWFAMPTEEG